MSKTTIQATASIRQYVIGFVISIWLTLTAYIIVTQHLHAKWTIVSIIVGVAMLQFLAQMFFFLHLGRETKPRWKLLVFVFMIGVVSIFVFGSLWIMNNLNYRMTPKQIQTYMDNQSGF
jgi:cytochrome o ubiquinol oxidase operon protein cyoD